MLWTLLIAFLVKHFLADFPLQTTYMLGKSKRAGWAVPLLGTLDRPRRADAGDPADGWRGLARGRAGGCRGCGALWH